jgi:ribose 5-phosphate isomerase RpiB
MPIGMATDHGRFALKEELVARSRAAGREVVDFGAHQLMPDDDYPDFVVPLVDACAGASSHAPMANQLTDTLDRLSRMAFVHA